MLAGRPTHPSAAPVAHAVLLAPRVGRKLGCAGARMGLLPSVLFFFFNGLPPRPRLSNCRSCSSLDRMPQRSSVAMRRHLAIARGSRPSLPPRTTALYAYCCQRRLATTTSLPPASPLRHFHRSATLLRSRTPSLFPLFVMTRHM